MRLANALLAILALLVAACSSSVSMPPGPDDGGADARAGQDGSAGDGDSSRDSDSSGDATEPGDDGDGCGGCADPGDACQGAACCTPVWTDAGSCGCTPTPCGNCSGTKPQTDGCNGNREIACTVAATGCGGACCNGACCDESQLCYGGACLGCIPNATTHCAVGACSGTHTCVADGSGYGPCAKDDASCCGSSVQVCADNGRCSNPQPNLVVNADFELGTSTLPDAWSPEPAIGTAIQTWDASAWVSPGHAVTTQMATAGQADWRQYVAGVDPSIRYRLRGHIRASNVAAGAHGIELQWFDATGTYLDRFSLSSSVQDQWAEVTAEAITPPAGAANVWVLLRTYQIGTYSFDDIVVTREDENLITLAGAFPLGVYNAPSTELLKNVGFDAGSAGSPTSWTREVASGAATQTWDGQAVTTTMTAAGQADWRLQVTRIDPALPYRLSGRILADNVGASSHGISLQWFDAGNGFISQDVLTADVTGSWTARSVSGLRPPAGAVYAWLLLRTYEPGTYSFDDVSLQAELSPAEIYGDVRAAGFNFAGSGSSLLEPLLTAGLEGALYTDTNVVGGNTAPLLSYVDAWRTHAALGFWLAPDEPSWNGTPAANLVDGYDALVLADAPGPHPVWLTHAPRGGPPPQDANFDVLTPYAGAADIHAIDIYPVPCGCGHSNLPNQDLSSVGDYTDIVHDKLASSGGVQRKVIWMVLQGFGWPDLVPGGGDERQRPTWEQTRFMAYDAIIHGARGLAYWGTAYIPITSQLWVDLERMAGELRTLSGALTSPTSFRTVTVSSASLESLLLQSGADLYLLTANRTATAVDASVSLSGLPLTTVTRMFEPGALALTASSFTDSFGPFQVHVYRLR